MHHSTTAYCILRLMFQGLPPLLIVHKAALLDKDAGGSSFTLGRAVSTRAFYRAHNLLRSLCASEFIGMDCFGGPLLTRLVSTNFDPIAYQICAVFIGDRVAKALHLVWYARFVFRFRLGAQERIIIDIEIVIDIDDGR